MSLTMWLLLILGLANDQLRLRAEGFNETCPGHEKWTVFQRRKYGNVDFYRGWDDYVNGFGDCDGDLWLGLEELHHLTKGGKMSLEINMMTKDSPSGDYKAGIHLVAKYSHFRIGPGYENYRLHVSGYLGGEDGDALSYDNNRPFSTKDANHDDLSWNCASDHEGGGWYNHLGGEDGDALRYDNNAQFSTKDANHDGASWNCAAKREGGGWYGGDNCGFTNLNGNFHETSERGFWWFPDDVPYFLCCSEMKIYKRP